MSIFSVPVYFSSVYWFSLKKIQNIKAATYKYFGPYESADSGSSRISTFSLCQKDKICKFDPIR